jgi:hypothetical protein
MSDALRRPPPLPQHALIWIVVGALVLVYLIVVILFILSLLGLR